MENNAHSFRTIATTQLCGSNHGESRVTRPCGVRMGHRTCCRLPIGGRGNREKGVRIMSETNVVTTELTTQYGAQVASDLERNLKEQDRVREEIEALQEQLTALQHDQTILVNVQQALGLPS